jgi:hypothetical protein
VSAFAGIADDYRTKGKSEAAAVPDFPNFRLGLNVASADQRVIILISGNEKEIKEARKSIPAVSNDPEIIGRFHYDFETDPKTWTGILTGSKSKSGINIIVPDTYGQKGKIIKSLPLDIKVNDLKAALLKANETFVKTTAKKDYQSHVQEGRRKGIKWTMPMEFGEDRDGDGKIDQRAGRRR